MPTKTSLCPTFYRLTFKKGKKLGENKRRRKTYEHNNDDLMGITGI